MTAGGDSLYGKRKVKDYVQRPKYELYDLEKDPDEVVNVADDPAHKNTFEQLAGKLKTFQQKTRDPWVVKYEYE